MTPQRRHKHSQTEHPSMLSIRAAASADAPLLKTLIHEFPEYQNLSVSVTEEDLLRDGFGLSPRFRALIAEWAGEPAGHALFFDYYSSFQGRAIFLEDIFIRPQFRGKALARRFSRIAAIARCEGPFGVIFNVFDWNTSAIDVYTKTGRNFLGRPENSLPAGKCSRSSRRVRPRGLTTRLSSIPAAARSWDRCGLHDAPARSLL
jgi:GNAT superfamily N-acetyltransferase